MNNFKNYYIYAEAVRNQANVRINVPEKITAENIDDHINAITSILKDGIETDYVHNMLFTCSWGGDKEADLFIVDYWYNLFMWKMILVNGDKIKPYHIFWSPELKRSNIKQYVDKYVLTIENKIKLGNVFLNNNICDGLWPFSYVEAFSYYLANTINNEDMIDLMNADPHVYDILHQSFADVPIGQVKDVGMKYTNELIDAIVNSHDTLGYDHGLKASFMASEAINPRQFKESVLNIGTKPNGAGGVWEHIVDKNFMNGGVNDLPSYFIESSASRYAQILSKKNVGDSGDIARLIGLNNTDTKLHPNMDYVCNSPNLVQFQIKTKKHLSMMKSRYYRFSPMGMDHLIDDEDTSLIGKTILLHSPMTCDCNSRGGGICRRCYGDLYYTNININPGKMAAEILTSQLTQILLSAKHLLETKIRVMNWNKEFSDYFDIDINSISLASMDDDTNTKKYMMIIDLDSIVLVNDEEDAISYDDNSDIIEDDDSGVYNKYISKFWIKTPEGQEIEFGTAEQDPLYISNELNAIIKRRSNGIESGKIMIPLSLLEDNVLFYVKVMNDEISKTMNDIVNVINKSYITENMNIHQILQALVDLVIKGNLSVDAVHLEVILANQLVDPKDILKKPNWSLVNAPYKIFTLNQALTNNPSPIVSILYKDLKKTLYNPLTFKKNAPSNFDLFFNEQPQNYMSDEVLDEAPAIMDPEKGITMVKIVDKKSE